MLPDTPRPNCGGAEAVRNIIAAAQDVQPDDAVEIARLAVLPQIQCDRELRAAAKKLGCSVPTLHAAVQAARRKGADADYTGRHGRRIEIVDLEPWPEPVDGAAVLDELARTIRDYIILSPRQADVVALWAVFTHTFDVFRLFAEARDPLARKAVRKDAARRSVGTARAPAVSHIGY